MANSKFNAATYNMVAKRFRETLDPLMQPWRYEGEKTEEKRHLLSVRGVVVNMALDFAAAFKKDNPKFDHLAWLDKCSPNVDLYPLSQLWEDEDG